MNDQPLNDLSLSDSSSSQTSSEDVVIDLSRSEAVEVSPKSDKATDLDKAFAGEPFDLQSYLTRTAFLMQD
jgi:hypothetical protein